MVWDRGQGFGQLASAAARPPCDRSQRDVRLRLCPCPPIQRAPRHCQDRRRARDRRSQEARHCRGSDLIEPRQTLKIEVRVGARDLLRAPRLGGGNLGVERALYPQPSRLTDGGDLNEARFLTRAGDLRHAISGEIARRLSSANEASHVSSPVEVTPAKAVVFCRWLRFEVEWTGQPWRRSAAWIARRCATGFIASPLRGRRVSSTTRRKVLALRLSAEQLVRGLRRSWRLARTVRKMASSGGGASISRSLPKGSGVDFHPRCRKAPEEAGLDIKRPAASSAQDRVIVLKAYPQGCPRRRRSKSGSKTKPGSTTPGRTASSASGAKRGTRPRAARRSALRQRLSGSARSAQRGASERPWRFPMPTPDITMQLHLDEISRNVAKGAHAVVLPPLLDSAGWHITSKLDMPENITLIFPAFAGPGAEPGRERLAVSPSELDLKHRLRKLPRHYRRRCLRRMAES